MDLAAIEKQVGSLGYGISRLRSTTPEAGVVDHGHEQHDHDYHDHSDDSKAEAAGLHGHDHQMEAGP